MSRTLHKGMQVSHVESHEELEAFKREFYEALLDLAEELRRIKDERQNHQAEVKPELVGAQL